MRDESREWFVDWFDSKYYPVLYKNRDEQEALDFVKTLLDHLNLTPKSKVLDLACGRGRHARFMHEYGYDVLGLDLSVESIEDAQVYAQDRLKFGVHDMRDPFPDVGFDAIFNLFTSFGYFDSFDQNLTVLNNIHKSLKPGGLLVLDYLNAHKVTQNLVAKEQKTIDGIIFDITRVVNNQKIIKQIQITDQKIQQTFTEKVSAIFPEDFYDMLAQSSFQLLETWGNYQGKNYQEDQSDRLILICQKV